MAAVKMGIVKSRAPIRRSVQLREAEVFGLALRRLLFVHE